MTRWTLAVAVCTLGACSTDVTAPARLPDLPSTGVTAESMAPALLLTAPGQLVTLEGGGRTNQVRFEAHMLVRETRDATPASDGAILVVSAADAWPLGEIDATKLRIDIQATTVDPDGTIHFRGPGVVVDADGLPSSFDAVGTAQAAGTAPDELIFDILGGDVYDEVRFTAQGAIREVSTP